MGRALVRKEMECTLRSVGRSVRELPGDGIAGRKGVMGTRSGLAVCWVAAVSLLHMSNAHAGGAFAVRQQSAYGQGTSFAGIAAGGSLSSMFWNPATLADVPRGEIEQVASGILGRTDVKLDPQSGLGFSGSDEGNISHDVF